MVTWNITTRGRLVQSLALAEEGTMCISGDYVWVKNSIMWKDTKGLETFTCGQLGERLVWFDSKWSQGYVLY